MIQGLLRRARVLFPFAGRRKLSEPSSPAEGIRMSRKVRRRVVVGIVLLAVLLGAGFGGYRLYVARTQGTPPSEVPPIPPTTKKLPTQEEFDALAKSDPVEMLYWSLIRYEREVKGGLRCTIEKQERVGGTPAHPEAPPVEVIDLRVRGDVPDPETKETAIEVLVLWKSGAKTPAGVSFAAPIEGSLYSDLPPPHGLGSKVVTWQPGARLLPPISKPMGADSVLAKGQSRFCVRDAGLYRTMLRTQKAWEARQTAGEFKYEYLGTKVVEKCGGRECHVVRRICPRTELDSFRLGDPAPTDPPIIAAEGFTEVVIYIDRERWLQVATEVYRTEPNGTKVTVATYHFRDVDLKPTFTPDTFTTASLKK